eukprot:scaffold21907_cov57-Phaeocystis_antarctica.AAC.2
MPAHDLGNVGAEAGVEVREGDGSVLGDILVVQLLRVEGRADVVSRRVRRLLHAAAAELVEEVADHLFHARRVAVPLEEDLERLVARDRARKVAVHEEKVDDREEAPRREARHVALAARVGVAELVPVELAVGVIVVLPHDVLSLLQAQCAGPAQRAERGVEIRRVEAAVALAVEPGEDPAHVDGLLHLLPSPSLEDWVGPVEAAPSGGLGRRRCGRCLRRGRRLRAAWARLRLRGLPTPLLLL